MLKIYFFKFTQFAIDTLPKTHIRNINYHYVLSFKEKFFIMTSEPVKNLKNTYINTPNIEGQLNKKQYVIEHLHIYNPKYHIFEFTAKGAAYLAEHQEKFLPVLE